MKSCAYCGRQNDESATYCRECGTAEFEGAVAAAKPVPPKTQRETEPVSEVWEQPCDVTAETETVLCTACLFPNLPESRWCKRCGAPMSSTVPFLMPDAAHAAGFAYRRAVETRPKLVVVGGVWLLFFPGLASGIFALFFVLGDRIGGLSGVASVLIAFVVITICGSMLYRVTRNYFAPPTKEPPESAA